MALILMHQLRIREGARSKEKREYERCVLIPTVQMRETIRVTFERLPSSVTYARLSERRRTLRSNHRRSIGQSIDSRY